VTDEPSRLRPRQPRIPPIEKVAARAREVAEGGLVRPINLTATLVHNRPIADATFALANVYFDPATIDPRLREVIILRMGWATGSVYEFGQHTLAARQVGLTDEEIRRTTEAIDETRWSPLESTALRMVDDLHRDDCVSDDVWSAISDSVDEPTAVAMIGLACYYRMVAGVLNSLGIQPEPDLPGWPTP
jgi:4-carboxymuconolactone decarboxylase